jgi:hypothetical protein
MQNAELLLITRKLNMLRGMIGEHLLDLLSQSDDTSKQLTTWLTAMPSDERIQFLLQGYPETITVALSQIFIQLDQLSTHSQTKIPNLQADLVLIQQNLTLLCQAYEKLELAHKFKKYKKEHSDIGSDDEERTGDSMDVDRPVEARIEQLQGSLSVIKRILDSTDVYQKACDESTAALKSSTPSSEFKKKLDEADAKLRSVILSTRTDLPVPKDSDRVAHQTRLFKSAELLDALDSSSDSESKPSSKRQKKY